MTPNMLLESVKLRFTQLMHDEEDKLEALLIQALRAYQDLAGYQRQFRVLDSTSTEIARPDDLLALVVVTDKTGDMVYSTDLGDVISLEFSWGTRFPVTVTYLADLASLDLETGIVPPDIVGIVSNYLEALIAAPNNDRIRRVSIAGKLDVSNLPDESMLYQRKIDLEADMKSRCAIIPGVSVYSSLFKGG